MDGLLMNGDVVLDSEDSEKPLIIDTAEHNHLQLLLLVNELKEHNSRSDALLSKTTFYIKEQACIIPMHI
jgi:hypothetical protein